MTDEELTPAQRERAQMVLLKRWLAAKFPREAPRRTDASATTESYDAKDGASPNREPDPVDNLPGTPDVQERNPPHP